MTFSDFSEPTSALFAQLGILKLHDVIVLNLRLFMHDWHNSKIPAALTNFFQIYTTSANTRMGTSHKLALPNRRTEMYGSASIKYKGALDFNKLIDLNINVNKSKLLLANSINGFMSES